jgi:hypothetical protein
MSGDPLRGARGCVRNRTKEPHVRPCGTNMGHPEQKLIQDRGETPATRHVAILNKELRLNMAHPPFAVQSVVWADVSWEGEANGSLRRKWRRSQRPQRNGSREKREERKWSSKPLLRDLWSSWLPHLGQRLGIFLDRASFISVVHAPKSI